MAQNLMNQVPQAAVTTMIHEEDIASRLERRAMPPWRG